MINRILVCLDKSSYTDSSIDYACWLAKHHDASLEGLVVLDTEGIQHSEAMVPLGQIHRAKTRIASKEKECHQLIEGLLEKFTQRCDAVGVRHTEFEMQGTPAKAILKESNYFDCVVIGLRTFFTYGSGAGADNIFGTDDDQPGDSLEEIMDESLAPIFAVPLNWQPDDEFDILIALNGSTHSMRALRQFARLYGSTTARATLLHCSDGSEEHLEILTKSTAYLRAHGFGHVEARTESGDVREVMSDEYCEPFDLIVLGAHGKSGVVEFFTGSLCKDFINRANKPLLIANG
ncbi:MAG: universal stress protein [Verrucomicrobiota bacterium]|jgi:nucleotide-binding universal stress UspA family protein|nr:universal stress protein [Verrucomicrobiota bacterium]